MQIGVSFPFITPGKYVVRLEAMNPKTGAMTPVEKTIYVIDDQPPSFEGVKNATAGDESAILRWDNATDSSSSIIYKV